jgi:hypothetical protein
MMARVVSPNSLAVRLALQRPMRERSRAQMGTIYSVSGRSYHEFEIRPS